MSPLSSLMPKSDLHMSYNTVNLRISVYTDIQVEKDAEDIIEFLQELWKKEKLINNSVYFLLVLVVISRLAYFF